MSYFNEGQRGYMNSLAQIPPAERCWCGWFRLGECHSCPPDKTAADKLAARCPSCHNNPGPEGNRAIVHRIGCNQSGEERGT